VKAQKTRRRGLRVYHAWIIWYAVVLHTVWGCLLLLSPAAFSATALHVFHDLPRGILAGTLFSASGLAVWALTRRQPSLKSLAALLPQQALLTLSAYAAVVAVFAAHYADGAPRPPLFILADQAPAIIAFVLHTAAVIEMHARRPDGELLRIIRLVRERGPAEMQDDLRAGLTRPEAAPRPSPSQPSQQPKTADKSFVKP
jgi:hypothetical protein